MKRVLWTWGRGLVAAGVVAVPLSASGAGTTVIQCPTIAGHAFSVTGPGAPVTWSGTFVPSTTTPTGAEIAGGRLVCEYRPASPPLTSFSASPPQSSCQPITMPGTTTRGVGNGYACVDQCIFNGPCKAPHPYPATNYACPSVDTTDTLDGRDWSAHHYAAAGAQPTATPLDKPGPGSTACSQALWTDLSVPLGLALKNCVVRPDKASFQCLLL